MKPWDGIIPGDEQEAYRAAGFGRRYRPRAAAGAADHRRAVPHGRHRAAAVLGGDQGVPHRLRRGRLGRGAAHRSGCWRCSAPRLAGALSLRLAEGDLRQRPARRQGAGADDGRQARLRLRRGGRAARPNDVLLPKKHPSAFFGTPLASYLVELGVDTLVVTGCTTSGCVRGTVVDGFAYNFRCLVPHDCVYDRSQVSHAVNLFDMSREIRRRDEHRRGDARLPMRSRRDRAHARRRERGTHAASTSRMRGGTVVLPEHRRRAGRHCGRRMADRGMLAPAQRSKRGEILDADRPRRVARHRSTCICISATARTSRGRAFRRTPRRDRRRGARRHHDVHSVPDGDRPFEAIFDDVQAVTEAGARIDFGYHFIISTEAQLAGVPRYAREFGAPSFKIFMNNRGGEGKRLGLPDIDDGFLLRLCEAAAAARRHGLPASGEHRGRLGAARPADGRRTRRAAAGLRAWNATRPPFVEADAVQRAGLFARQTGARLYIVHTSSRRGARRRRKRARDAGTDITIETCPHYLTHDVDWQGGDVGKINPPLRERADCEALWDGLARRRHRHGRDRSRASRHLRQGGRHLEGVARLPGHRDAPAGDAQRGASRARLPLGRIADARGAPGRAMGSRTQGPHRGRVSTRTSPSSICRPSTRHAASDLHSSAGYSIYEGVPLRGRVRHTLLGGRFVLRDHELVPDAVGTGRFVARQPG